MDTDKHGLYQRRNENHLVILKDETELTLSRRYRDKLSKKLGVSI
jgi:DNA-binding LytR/AlgR family response regulator